MRTATILAFLLVSACGSRQAAPVAPASIEDLAVEDVAAALEKAAADYKSVYESKDLDAITGLYQDGLDAGLVFQGKAYLGTTHLRAFIASRLEGATTLRMNLSDLVVVATGTSSGLVNASVEITIGDDAVSVTEKGALTLVYHKVDGQWRVLFEHFSYPPSR